MTTAPADRTDRRTRPKDRKQRILAAAAELFETSGYHAVGMSDIAARVGIVPSALYRHYRNKHELLVAAFDESVGRYEDAIADIDDPFEMTRSLVYVATDSQALDLLWSRDKGHLCPTERDALRIRIKRIAERLTQVTARDAELDSVTPYVTAWAVLSVVNWPGHRELPVPPGDSPRMLLSAANAVVRAGQRRGPVHQSPAFFDSRPTPVDGVGHLLPLARREALLNTAITMFAVHGYANVSLDDIGEAVGIAGPSVYNHFDSKRKILVCGLHRAFDAMWLELGHVLVQTADPLEALDELLAGYARFAQAHWDLIAVCLSHTIMLDGEELAALTRTYLDYIGEWRRLLQMCRPELNGDEAQTLVDLALGVVNGLVRVDVLRGPTLPADAHYLAKAVLESPVID